MALGFGKSEIEGWKSLDGDNIWLNLARGTDGRERAYRARSGLSGGELWQATFHLGRCRPKALLERSIHRPRHRPGAHSPRRHRRRESSPFFRRLHHLKRELLRSNHHRLEANQLPGLQQ